jgi:glutaconate CoA-transferase subunit B
VEKLDFVTAAGNLQTVVTPLAVFQKREGRLALESWNPQVTLDEVAKRTGFRFDAGAALPTNPISERERAALERLDPQGEFAATVRA